MSYLLTPEVRYVLQAYTHQMAACLAEDSGDGSPAMRRLQQLTDECWTLIVIIGLTHVSGVKDLQDCNMGEGVACPDAKQPEFYCAIMVGRHCICQCICVAPQRLPMLHLSLLYASKAARPDQFVQAQLTLNTSNTFSWHHSSVIV